MMPFLVCFCLREVTPSSKDVSKSLTRLRPRFFSPQFSGALSGTQLERVWLAFGAPAFCARLSDGLREQRGPLFDRIQHRLAFLDQREPFSAQTLRRGRDDLIEICFP